MKSHNERPILFSAPMVLAILEGRKTQTRRALRIQPPAETQSFSNYHHPDPRQHHYAFNGAVLMDFAVPCPYGKPGDRLWVKETHRPIVGQSCGLIAVDYRADPPEKWTRLGDEIGKPHKWVPSIFMRREYSRITLEVTAVRVDRLQAITDGDVIAEGINRVVVGSGYPDEFSATPASWGEVVERQANSHEDPRLAYRDLWEAINSAGSWDENPWVWVVEFAKATP